MEKKKTKKTEDVLIPKFLLSQYISVHRGIPAKPVKDRWDLQVFKLNLFMEDCFYFLEQVGERLQILGQLDQNGVASVSLSVKREQYFTSQGNFEDKLR